MMDARGTLWSTAELGQRGAGDRSGHRQGRAHRCRRLAALDRDQPCHRQTVRLVQDQGSGGGGRPERRAASSARSRSRTAPKASRSRPTARRCSSARIGRACVHVFDARSARAAPDHRPSTARRARPTSCAACGCRRTGVTSASPRMSTVSPRSTTPIRSSRSPALPRRRRRWASASPPTASTPICAATTPPITLEFELASGRVTRQFPTAAGCEFIIAY